MLVRTGGEGAGGIAVTLFRLHDEQGVPLSLSLQVAKREGLQLDVPGFFRDAVAAGWKEAKALAVIDGALSDAGEPRGYIDRAKAWLVEPATAGEREDQALASEAWHI